MKSDNDWQALEDEFTQLLKDRHLVRFHSLVKILQRAVNARLYPPEIFLRFIKIFQEISDDVQQDRDQKVPTLVDQVASRTYIQPDWQVDQVIQNSAETIVQNFFGQFDIKDKLSIVIPKLLQFDTHLGKPSWTLFLPKPRPVLLDCQISTILKGYNPFPNPLAEYELDFLFGEVGGFWSGHPTYITISSNFFPEVVLADSGGGKTAFAYALSQLGDVDGNPLPDTLPISVSGENGTLQNIEFRLANNLLNFIRINPSRWSKLGSEQKNYLLRLLVNGVGSSLVNARLAQVGVAEEQAEGNPWQNQREWLQYAQECLDLLGFERAVLAIDCNQQHKQQIEFFLQHMLDWASHSIITKLFCPKSLQSELNEYLRRIKLTTLAWDDDQIAEMVSWRFNSLARLADIRSGPEILFEENLYPEFIQQATHNPHRLAQLWRHLFDDYLKKNPERITFSRENLDQALEQLS